jgi:hypothetical protein
MFLNDLKKYKTKDKRLTQKIRDSVDIGGELDSVKLSPRHNKPRTSDGQMNPRKPNSRPGLNTKKDNGVVLNPDQLMSIISAIQTDGAQIEIGMITFDH